MKEYCLELIFDIDDTDEGIKELRTLIENYDSVHVASKESLRTSMQKRRKIMIRIF